MGNLYDARENRKMQQVKTTPYLFLQMVQFQKSEPLKNINNDALKFPMVFVVVAVVVKIHIIYSQSTEAKGADFWLIWLHLIKARSLDSHHLSQLGSEPLCLV